MKIRYLFWKKHSGYNVDSDLEGLVQHEMQKVIREIQAENGL